jgi:mono/diheme cytochrome c family protein
MRKGPTFIIAIVAIGSGLGAFAAWTVAATEGSGGLLRWQDPATVVLGGDLYEVHCASCHGASLEGQDDWQQRLPNGRLPAPPHDETGHTWHHPDALLIAITTEGTAALVGDGYESDMIGFGDILSEAEIVAVLSYIKSTWPVEVIDIHNEINARFSAE